MVIRTDPVFEHKANCSVRVYSEWIVLRLSVPQCDREYCTSDVRSCQEGVADFKGFSTINAKAETLTTKPMWHGPFLRHRCLVPADGFYEWETLDPKTKQPYAFTMRSGQPFAFGGVWDAWKEPDGGWLQSFAIITIDPNELTATVHNLCLAKIISGAICAWILVRKRSNIRVDCHSVNRPSESGLAREAPRKQIGLPTHYVPHWMEMASALGGQAGLRQPRHSGGAGHPVLAWI